MNAWLIDSYIFKHPFNCVINGPTNSGKTFLLTEIIKYRDVLINDCPNHFIYCYKTWQPSYDKIKVFLPSMLFIEGIPDPDQLQSLSNRLIIFDDLNSQYINNHEIMDIFTVGSHHRNISVIVISHNIFAKGKFSREIRLEF